LQEPERTPEAQAVVAYARNRSHHSQDLDALDGVANHARGTSLAGPQPSALLR